MKKAIVIFIVLYVFTGCTDSDNDLKLLGLKSKVKTCIQKGYAGVNVSGQWEKEENIPIYTATTHFDKDGNVTEYYLDSNDSKSKMINSRKNKDNFESIFYDENDNIVTIQKNKYISPDKLVSENFDAENNYLYTDTSYLENGVVIRDYYDQGGAVINYKYQNGFLSQTSYISEYAELTDNYNYLEFDKKDNWTLRSLHTKYIFLDGSGDEYLETEITEQILEYY